MLEPVDAWKCYTMSVCHQVTTPDDMLIAEGFIMSKGVEDILEISRSDFSETSVV